MLKCENNYNRFNESIACVYKFALTINREKRTIDWHNETRKKVSPATQERKKTMYEPESKKWN